MDENPSYGWAQEPSPAGSAPVIQLFFSDSLAAATDSVGFTIITARTTPLDRLLNLTARQLGAWFLAALGVWAALKATPQAVRDALEPVVALLRWLAGG